MTIQALNQIWNLEHYVQFIWFDDFLIYWDDKTKYLGHDLQWAIFEIIASLE